jgi:hypothetical protein
MDRASFHNKLCVCVFVCVCVIARDRERVRDNVCVCVCMCVILYLREGEFINTVHPHVTRVKMAQTLFHSILLSIYFLQNFCIKSTFNLHTWSMTFKTDYIIFGCFSSSCFSPFK